MNNLVLPPRQPDLDGLLRTFFRKEMPDPWPKLDLPLGESRDLSTAVRRGWRFPARFALAAAVTLFLGSYFFLAGWFPTRNFSSSGPDSQLFIGQKPHLNHRPEAGPVDGPIFVPQVPGLKKGQTFPSRSVNK